MFVALLNVVGSVCLLLPLLEVYVCSCHCWKCVFVVAIVGSVCLLLY